MAKLGQDWLYIGLGIGAVYLVYKLTKPVADLTQSVSDFGSNVVGGASDLFDTVSSPFTLTTPAGQFPSVSDMLWKSPLVTIPAGVTATINAAQSMFEKKASSNSNLVSKAVNPKTVQQKTNIAAAQGLVSVAPPKMSVLPGTKISPFTGQPFR